MEKTRTAVVTGGTRGIGGAISEALKAAGYRVIANYASHDEVARSFQEKTGIETLKWNVGDPEVCSAHLKAIEDRFGGVDILVNNAGITRDARFHKMTLQDWRAVLSVNLDSLFHMTHPVWEGMRSRRFGRIICISSVNAQKGQAGQVNYCTAKAGELGFIKALAQEGAQFGITVNAICPGYINTEMVRAIAPEILQERILPQIPLGRLGTPEEIARCVAFLASDDSGFITGATLSINGGQFMS